MNKMNKKALISKVVEESHVSQQDTEKVIDSLFMVIVDEVTKGNSVQITNFGTFKQVTRQSRIARNPNTNELITIPESKKPIFRAGKQFKDKVKG